MVLAECEGFFPFAACRTWHGNMPYRYIGNADRLSRYRCGPGGKALLCRPTIAQRSRCDGLWLLFAPTLAGTIAKAIQRLPVRKAGRSMFEARGRRHLHRCRYATSLVIGQSDGGVCEVTKTLGFLRCAASLASPLLRRLSVFFGSPEALLPCHRSWAGVLILWISVVSVTSPTRVIHSPCVC